MIRFLGACCGIIFTYGCGAFIGLEMNPLSWTTDGRFIFIGFATAFAVLGAAIIGD